VKLLLLDDADSTSNARPASNRLKNSALTLGGVARRNRGKHPGLRQDDRRRTVGRRSELDGRAVGLDGRILVLQRRFRAVASAHGHRSVWVNLEFAAAVEEWDEVEPQQNQPRNQQHEQCSKLALGGDQGRYGVDVARGPDITVRE
jgi:hypothetical protein